MLTEAQKNCDHDWRQFSIAMLGIRWQCTKTECNLIAPPCFIPIQKSRESAGLPPLIEAAKESGHLMVVSVP